MLTASLRLFILLVSFAILLGGCKPDNKLDVLANTDAESGSQPEPPSVGNSAIEFSPSSYDFGPAAQNIDVLNHLISLENTSPSEIYISEFTGLDSHFEILNSNCPTSPQSLASEESCQMTIQFAPKSAGSLNTSLIARYGPEPANSEYLSLMGLSGIGVGSLNFSGVTNVDNIRHNSLRLNWTAEAQAVSFMVYRVVGPNLNFIETVVNTGGTKTNHTLNGLSPNTNYLFRVRAIDSLGSQDGNTVDYSVTTLPNLSPSLQSIVPPTFYSGMTLANIDARDGNTLTDFDVDSDPITYTCRFDNVIDGTVSSVASECTTLISEDSSSPSFSSSTGVLSGWTPRHSDVGVSFEFSIEGRDPYAANSIVVFSGVINAGTPQRPLVLSVSPLSPANNNAPVVTGTAEPNMTIRLFSNSACSSSLLGSGTSDVNGDWSVPIAVADDSSTTVYAAARNAIGNDSLCSLTSLVFVEDSTPPSINVLGTTPSLFGLSTTPSVNGVSNPSASIQIFSDSGCSVLESTGTADGGGSFSIGVTLMAEETQSFYARATDAAGNQSLCSSTFATYTAFPIDPVNLMVWADGDDPDTLIQSNGCTGGLAVNVGDPVGCWLDKSGLDNHLTIATNKPTRAADGARFNGTNTVLTNTGISLNANSNVTYFVVVRAQTQTVNTGSCCRPFVSWVTSSSGLYPWVGMTRDGFTPPNNLFFGWSGASLAPTAISAGDELLVTASHDGSGKKWNTRFYGTSNLVNQTIPATYTTATALTLGGDVGNAVRTFNGDIMEFIMYNEVLSNSRIQDIEGYLACKYSYRDLLPGAHPYYNAIPNSPTGCPN